MKIFFDISQTGFQKAGCGYYAYTNAHLLSESKINDNILFFTHFGDFFYDKSLKPKELFSNYTKMKFSQHLDFNQVKYFWLSKNLKKFEHNTIFHSNNFWSPDFFLKNFIYTLYDLSFLDCPEFTIEENRQGCLKGLLNAIKFSNKLISISESTKNRFYELFSGYSDEIKVVYPISRFREKTNQIKKFFDSRLKKSNFWLTLGTIEPRKNLKIIIDNFEQYLKNSNEKKYLVIVGKKGWMHEQLLHKETTKICQEKIIFTGYLDDTNLNFLISNAFSTIYPSFYEGFGMPVLESISLETPVIASKIDTNFEILGNKYNFLFDPYNPDQLISKMVEMENLSKEQLENLKNYLNLQKIFFSNKNKKENITNIYNNLI